MRRLNALNQKQALKVVKELDAFPKVPDDYKKTTPSGGGISIVVFILIGVLVMSEVAYYASTQLKFDYEVDTDADAKLKINIDMTVAMPCQFIGADVVDMTGQDTNMFGHLNMDNTYFQLTPKQRQYQDVVQEINAYLREEYHAIQELLWMSGISAVYKRGMPPRDDNPVGQPDACRVHGSLEVNKVAGNFHITAGKSVPMIPRGHAHISMMIKNSDYNFSHRIDHFSFGEAVNGVINPLDGEENVTPDNFHMYQYFMQIVPTEVRTYAANVDTYQYAVSHRNRSIDHSSGSHGVPGIFVKYDLNSLKIRVREVHRPFGQFLIRLVGIIGGIFSVSGIMHSLAGVVTDLICCKFKLGQYKMEDITSNFTNSSSITDNFPSENIPGVNLLATDS
ncbi:endoplasmic reticulum-Golgi intermediate compartment protein 2-like isoform X1 [Ylistrum balloti]|uniref:endoplasmic reticulum-Golgi intermediate compartment protein 2-like isoform X1 n=1 Tax=Ylistrum balloti TaxID=509963 RepID=UPI002905E954|nr:endoplasmic reticulum-Golgi intermediate compartment protein 2-like isoform X1 [Ylistrum balloti]